VNTCAIREKAEDKLYSALGRYRLLKSQRGTRLAVSGCVAQQEKAELLARAPYVDFVLGPDQLSKVAELADKSAANALGAPGSSARVETDWMPSEEYLFPQADAQSSAGKATAFVTVMKGCDNVCSFCVVPYTRGREVSRPYAEIVREVAQLARVGIREVTLIGQNVNSYQGGCTFAELIRRVGEVPGVARIRFTTSHPMDLSEELVACFAPESAGGVRALMPHFHLPVQHGSDAVLKRMRRSYTIAEYERRIAQLLALRPELALTSDIICGFPGETDAEHALNMEMLARVPYDNLFSFIFSSRPHTTAEKMLEKNALAAVPSPDWIEVPRELALRRLEEVQALQRARTTERRRAFIGQELEVLVEQAQSDAGTPGDRFGRSRENWTVHFNGRSRVGDIVRVRVARASMAAMSGDEIAIADPTPFIAPSTASASRHRLAVVSV